MNTVKPMINITIVGHVDHGKSTLLGRLFYELGEIPKEALEKLEKQAESLGKKSFEFAFIFDKSLESRQRGVTIDLGFRGFETAEKKYNIIDAPGHKDFIRNMLTGASEADAGVIVVDVSETFRDGLKPQTKEHSILLYTLGVNQLFVVLNKMDKVEYSKEVYESVKDTLLAFFKQLGYKQDIFFVPTSAYLGENVTRKSDKMPWYNGPTFLGALNTLKEPERHVDKPFRMPILRTFKTSAGPVIAGKVESGKVSVGDTVVIVPYPGRGIVKGEIKSIEWQHKQLTEATPGFDVGIMLTRTEKGFVTRQVKKGYVMGSLQHPPVEVTKFKAKILVIDHPSSIGKGYSPMLYCHQAQIPCRIEEIEDKFDPKTGEIKEKNPSFLKNGDGATVSIVPLKPLVIEEVSKVPRMARFALRDMGRTVGAGMCIKIGS
jgi:elongation factor 1-alpha